jgi:hypothetical protein
MRRKVLKLISLGGALVWVLSTTPAGPAAKAQVNNCYGFVAIEGWKYVLANPHCGREEIRTLTYTATPEECAAYFQSVAPQLGPQMCGHVCDQEGSAQYGWNASAWTSGTCYVHFDGDPECVYYWSGVC